jgi:hypothetical protein
VTRPFALRNRRKWYSAVKYGAASTRLTRG